MSSEKLLEKALREEYEREQCEFHSSEEIKDLEMPELPLNLQEEIDKLLKKANRKRKFRMISQNVASLIAVAIGSFFLIFLLDQDVRATCLQWIKTAVSGGMTNYKSASSDKSTSPDTNSGSVAGFSLEYIPDGYVLKNADMEEDIGTVTYCKGTEQLIFHYAIAKDADTAVDNENCILSNIELQDGTLCDFYQSNSDQSDSRLIWQKEGFFCTLYITELEETELIRIAEGVKITNS